MKSISLCLLVFSFILGLDIYTTGIKNSAQVDHHGKRNHYLALQLAEFEQRWQDCGNGHLLRIYFNSTDWVEVECKLKRSNLWKVKR
mgnify:FL=1